MQGTVFYQVNQEFPQSTCCQEKRKNSWFPICSAGKGGDSACWPIRRSVNQVCHLLLSGLKSPGGTASARNGEPCADWGPRCEEPSARDLPGHQGTSENKSQKGVRQPCFGPTSNFTTIAIIISKAPLCKAGSFLKWVKQMSLRPLEAAGNI